MRFHASFDDAWHPQTHQPVPSHEKMNKVCWQQLASILWWIRIICLQWISMQEQREVAQVNGGNGRRLQDLQAKVAQVAIISLWAPQLLSKTSARQSQRALRGHCGPLRINIRFEDPLTAAPARGKGKRIDDKFNIDETWWPDDMMWQRFTLTYSDSCSDSCWFTLRNSIVGLSRLWFPVFRNSEVLPNLWPI